MLYTQRIREAIQFSINTHEITQKQKRKGKDVPYIVHPLTVALILGSVGASEDVVVAGILHDTIEDSVPEKKVTKKMITDNFGKAVSDLVLSVTEQNRSIPWEERKAEALQHIKKFTFGSHLLKSADVLANASELIDDYEREGDLTFKRFHVPKARMIGHYLEATQALINKWPKSPLKDDLQEIRGKLAKILE